jgi:hypothetical protein
VALGGKACGDWLTASGRRSRARVTASRCSSGEPADTAGYQQLSGIPLRLRLAGQPTVPRHDRGRVPGTGFEPLLSRPFTAPQDILAETGTGPHAWTVFYTAADLIPARVAFRPLARLTLPASRCPRPPAPTLRRLLRACAPANSAQTRKA